MKKKILIISGGISKERLISLDTGLQVAKELRKNSYNVQISEPNRNLQKIINKFNPDVIFNALHGQYGEDGYIQTILERFNIPYTHSGVIPSAIAMDKEISKKLFIKYKIITPKFFTYSFDKKNPQLVGTYMEVAGQEFIASVMTTAVWEIAEAIDRIADNK